MGSNFQEQFIDLVQTIKKLTTDTELTDKELDSVVNKAIAIVAAKYGISNGTLRSKLTRGLELTTAGFKSHIKVYLQGSADELIKVIVTHNRSVNEAELSKALKAIREENRNEHIERPISR